MSANNSSGSINDFDGPLNINDPIDTAVGRRISDRFASWADGADDPAAVARRVEVAYARLAEDAPELHTAVQACVVEGLSSRKAAPRCGVRHKAVLERKTKGLTLLRRLYRFDIASDSDVLKTVDI